MKLFFSRIVTFRLSRQRRNNLTSKIRRVYFERKLMERFAQLFVSRSSRCESQLWDQKSLMGVKRYWAVKVKKIQFICN